MNLIRRIKKYCKKAYRLGHFPSIWEIIFTKKTILAYYGFLGDGNVGDELVYEAAKRLFPSCMLIPISRYRPISLQIFEKRIIEKTKGLIIGGGTLIGDNKIDQYSYIQKILGKTLFIYIHGTGIKRTILEQWNTILTNSKIYGGLRGPFSLNIANQSHLHFPMIIGDAACFFFTNNQVYKKYSYKKILLNYGTHLHNEDSILSREIINEFVVRLISEGYEVCFLPFHIVDYKIGEKLKRDYHHIKLLNIPNSLEQIRQIFNSADYAIGERLHFNIMALLSNCPFFSVNYANKHIDFLNSLGLKYCGENIKDISMEQLIYSFENRDNLFNWYKINMQLDSYKKAQIREAENFINSIK